MLSVNNATLKLSNKTIFKNYSFEVKKGDIVVILGPNGKGKTSLLKSILSLIPLNGGDIKTNTQIAYVPQNTSITFDYKVIDVVLMGRAKHLGFFSSPSKNDYNLSMEILKSLNMQEFEQKNFSQLSGGEKQLILIARAMVSQCDFLILDEPASALDFYNQKKILNTLKNLNKTKNLTILYTTHYPQHALHLSTKVLLMFDEKKYMFERTDQLMKNDILSELYGIEIQKLSFNHENKHIETIIPIF